MYMRMAAGCVLFQLVTPKFARVSALHGTLHSITASPCSSRPPSRAVSLCDGSSGYESTMSHLGPHYNVYNVPRSNSPVLKYNTLKPRRRKQKHSQQFYSLRLCRRHESIRRKYELYAIPIYKTCPHRSDSTATIATIVRSVEDAPSLTLSQASASISLMSRSAPSTPIPPSPTTPIPPVPAPRMSKQTDPSKHTYQNVPPPVFPPKNASLPKLNKVCRLLMIYNMNAPHPITLVDIAANELLGKPSLDRSHRQWLVLSSSAPLTLILIIVIFMSRQSDYKIYLASIYILNTCFSFIYASTARNI